MLSFAAMSRVWMVLAVWLAPSVAWALGTAHGPGKWKVDKTEIVVAKDGAATTVTARFSATTSAQGVLVVFPVPATTSSVRMIDDLAALDDATTPLFVEQAATDPCAKDATPEATAWRFPREVEALAAKYAVELVDTLPAEAKGAPHADKYVVWRVTPKAAQRARWTRAVQWRFVGDAPLALDRLAAWTPVGREHRVTLYTAAEAVWTPTARVEPIGAAAPVAEVAFETPRDIVEAITRHAMRRAPKPDFVRTFVGHIASSPRALDGLGAPEDAAVARFEAVATDATEAASFEAKALIQAERAEWTIRRKWRAKSQCLTARDLNGVRIEQTSELRAYAAMTGRPVATIRQRSAERGYELGPKGLAPVKVKAAPGGRRADVVR